MKTGRGGPCPPKTGGCDTLRLPASCPHCHWGVNPLPAPPAPPRPRELPPPWVPSSVSPWGSFGGDRERSVPWGGCKGRVGTWTWGQLDLGTPHPKHPGAGEGTRWGPPKPPSQGTLGQESRTGGAPPNLHPKGPQDRRGDRGGSPHCSPQTSIPGDPRTGGGTQWGPQNLHPQPPWRGDPEQERGPGGLPNSPPKTFIPRDPREGTLKRRGDPELSPKTSIPGIPGGGTRRCPPNPPPQTSLPRDTARGPGAAPPVGPSVPPRPPRIPGAGLRVPGGTRVPGG